MQEIPEPVTQIVWDSWAEIHPETAKEIGVASNQVVEVTSSEGVLQAPALVERARRARHHRSADGAGPYRIWPLRD